MLEVCTWSCRRSEFKSVETSEEISENALKSWGVQAETCCRCRATTESTHEGNARQCQLWGTGGEDLPGGLCLAELQRRDCPRDPRTVEPGVQHQHGRTAEMRLQLEKAGMWTESSQVWETD